jgi:hypothetical protein
MPSAQFINNNIIKLSYIAGKSNDKREPIES